jgi:hypothetical protein
MPAPSVTSRIDTQEDAATSTHDVSYPATMNAGEMALAFISCLGGAAQDLTWPTADPDEWTSIGTPGGLGGGSGIFGEVAIHEIDGGEGTSFPVTSATAVESCHRVWSGPFGEPIIAGPLTANSATASFPTVTVPEGDYLVLALIGSQFGAGGMGYTTPADYGEAFSQTTGNNGVEQGAFERALTGITSETPGDTTMPSARRWVTFTVAIPAAAGGGEFQVAWAIGSNVLIQ